MHNAESGRAIRAALTSLVISAVDITGIIQAVRGRYAAVAFVVGCAVGTGAAVAYKSRRA